MRRALDPLAAKRPDDAGAMFDKLLADPGVSIDVRARAGRFWAELGDIDRARAQGDAILKVEEQNPAGLYLRGEGLLADRKYAEARRMFQQAVDTGEQAQYLEALGRVNEIMGAVEGETRYKEEALRAYQRAK